MSRYKRRQKKERKIAHSEGSNLKEMEEMILKGRKQKKEYLHNASDEKVKIYAKS